VRIETSNDLRAWSMLQHDGALVDLEHGGARLTRKRVDIAPTAARYLRVTWADKPFVLKSLMGEVQSVSAAPALSRHVVDADMSPSQDAQPGEYAFDLGGRLPVREIRLLLPEPNTVAPVRIFARSDAAQPWQQVDSATFYRLNREGAELVSPPVKLPQQNERFWKIAIDARAGGLGQGRPRLEVGWQPQSIVFAARGEGPYRLAWGHATAGPAHLSLTALMPGYRAESEYSLPLAQPGELIRQTVMPPSALQKLTQAFTWKQGVLWLVLLLGVGGLGFMAWRLNAQMAGAQPQSGGRKEAS
jgi:hypothetical protein